MSSNTWQIWFALGESWYLEIPWGRALVSPQSRGLWLAWHLKAPECRELGLFDSLEAAKAACESFLVPASGRWEERRA